jgi:hypothetical protein
MNAINQMHKLPYIQNEAVASGLVHNDARHEDAVADVLKENNFTHFIPAAKLHRKEALLWMDQPHLANGIPNGHFIKQPFGKQKSPDFIVKVSDSFVLFLEAKSSATALAPTYNSGIPHENFIYVFCAKKTNETTIYKGDSIINCIQQELIQQHIIEARKRDKELKEALKLNDTNHRGIAYYTRPMIIQRGGGDYTNYFTHAHREHAEQTAIDWITAQCYSK